MTKGVETVKKVHGIDIQGDTFTVKGVHEKTVQLLLKVFDNGGYVIEETEEGILFRPVHRT